MQKMKILFSPCHYVYDEFQLGSEWSWAFEIADRIASRNTDSVVVTGIKKLKNEKPYKIIEVDKDKKKSSSAAMNVMTFNVRYFRETKRQLKNGFDILHHVLPFGIDSTFNLNFLSGKKSLPKIIGPIQSPISPNVVDKDGTTHAPIFRIALAALQPILRMLSRLTLNHADAVVAINDHTKNLLIKDGIKPEKISVIPPGIDTKTFDWMPFDEKRSDKLELLVVSYLYERKSIDLVVKALHEIVKQRKDIILRVIGYGPQERALRDLVQELDLQEHVVFEGFVDNFKISGFYKKAHVFISMTQEESWGQMYLEAMASGLPIITTKNVGSFSIIKDERFAYFVERDHLDLCKKVLKLLNNPKLISEMGKNARIEAEKKYDWDSCIIPKYLALYEKYIKSHE